jgi:Flp pilus assembly protein TadG
MPVTAARPETPLRHVARLLVRLCRDRSANSLIEFAYALPILLTLCMYGIELAYMHSVNMQVSQIAMALADNASRLGQTNNSAVTPSISNADISSVMGGAMRQGASINFSANGRLILSSLERDTATGRQYIHWQKCSGSMTTQSSAYGPVLYGYTGATITGLGKPGRVVSANANSAVMFVEAYYNYKPLFGNMFVKNTKFSQEAAFIVRDDRDLAGGVAGTTDC